MGPIWVDPRWVEARAISFIPLTRETAPVRENYVLKRGIITKRPAHEREPARKREYRNESCKGLSKECTTTVGGSMQIRRMKRIEEA